MLHVINFQNNGPSLPLLKFDFEDKNLRISRTFLDRALPSLDNFIPELFGFDHQNDDD